MQPFIETRTTPTQHIYDLAMPANASSYGDSKVTDADGKTHVQLTHSQVRMWATDDPSKPASATVVYGDGAGSESVSVGPGAVLWPVPKDGLVSIVCDRPLAVYADVFGVWAN